MNEKNAFRNSAQGWREVWLPCAGKFSVSRKTGYKIFERYEECGLEGLSDRTRRPFRYANQLPEQLEGLLM